MYEDAVAHPTASVSDFWLQLQPKLTFAETDVACSIDNMIMLCRRDTIHVHYCLTAL